jgi:predicted ferric reductase
MSIWYSIVWDTARASGLTAYLLGTLAVIVGLMLSLKWQSPRWWPRLINNEMHNFLSLLSVIFVVIHVASVWIDPFTRFGWAAIFIPFVSNYRPLGMALGIVGLYLGLALSASVWLRPKIGYLWWRRIHYLTLLVYVFILIHVLLTGTDAHASWVVVLYVSASSCVGILLLIRIITAVRTRNRAIQSAPVMKQGRG